MTNFARSLSPRTEFVLVVGVAFGYIILGNLLDVLEPTDVPALRDESLWSLVRFELVVMCVLAPLLYVRGWRLSRLGRPFLIADLAGGAALAFVAYGASLVISIVAAMLDSNIAASMESPSFLGNDLGLRSILAVSIVNPVFEEVFLCGYIVTVLKERRSFWTAVNVSLAIRLACHLYQGAVGVLGILPLGYMFTYWYARTGRLWPVVIAHAIFDLTGLWPYLAP